MDDQAKAQMYGQARASHTSRLFGEALSQTVDLQAQIDVISADNADLKNQVDTLTAQLNAANAKLDAAALDTMAKPISAASTASGGSQLDPNVGAQHEAGEPAIFGRPAA